MSRPLPRPTAETRPFWEGCEAGLLRFQACRSCAAVQAIPRSLCARCQSASLVWNDSAGFGRVLSHTTVHRAPTPAFREETPYVIALVDMDEGFRLMANVSGAISVSVQIGTRVKVGFRRVDGVALPHVEALG